MLSAPEIVLAILAMAAGCAFQAAVGMGFALLSVPVLALIDPRFIPGPVLFAGVALAAATTWRDRAAIDRGKLKLSMAGLAVGTAVGVAALKLASGPHLTKVFGGLILLAVIVSLAARRIADTPRLLLAASTASGVMGTMVGMHGPAIALAFQNSEPAVTRAMLGAFFTISYAVAVAALAMVGLFGWEHLMLGLMLLPGAALGYAAAPLIAPLIDKSTARVLILSVCTFSGLLLLLR